MSIPTIIYRRRAGDLVHHIVVHSIVAVEVRALCLVSLHRGLSIALPSGIHLLLALPIWACGVGVISHLKIRDDTIGDDLVGKLRSTEMLLFGSFLFGLPQRIRLVRGGRSDAQRCRVSRLPAMVFR